MTEVNELMRKLSLAGEAPETEVIPGMDSERAARLAEHRVWLSKIRHEVPSPSKSYNVGIYIRYFNQTKYENYLEYHVQMYKDTLALCPNWNLVDFYIDEGAVAPNMENAKEWSRLLQDCFDGKVNLIITQKISNVSRKDYEITFIARSLAAMDPPVGIYFVSEDVFTLASYYQSDLRDTEFLPEDHINELTDRTDKTARLPESIQREE